MTAHDRDSGDGDSIDPNDDWPGRLDGAPEPAPNVEVMRAHLELLFGGDRCAGMLNSYFEIAWTDSYGKPNHGVQFGIDKLDEAAEYGAKQNRNRGVNVFVGAALRKSDTPTGKRAKKEHVDGMTAAPVDWDDEGEGNPDAIKRKTAFLPPNFVVVTGEHPWMRSQGWWVLDEPLMGVEAIEALMRPMAKSLNGDRAVVNADRVMRLAGTQAWAHKPGRIREQTYLVTKFQSDGDKPRPPNYPTDRVLRAFQAKDAEQEQGQEQSSAGAGSADPHAKNAYTGRFDGEALLRSIRPGNWHLPMRDFVAHMVGRGRQDWEIRAMTAPYDEPGHQGITVQDLIDGARAKWNKPNPADPASEFDFSQEPPAPLNPQSAADIVVENIRRRPWLFGRWLLKGYLSMLVGTGGTGKSMLAIHMALAIAANKAWAGQKVSDPGGVWIWNNEDDAEELHRRIGGTAKHLGIGLTSLDGKLFANSGVDNGEGGTRKLIVAVAGDHGSVIATPDVQAIVQHIKDRGIKLLIVDPFVSTHTLNENDNPQMEAVTFLYRQIAHQADCAVLLVHHTSKPGDTDQAGNQHSSRGASSITAAARVVLTVTAMSDADAKRMMGEDYPEKDREHCIRVDVGKANLSAPGRDTTFLRKVGVSLGNGSNAYVEDDADEIGGLEVADFSAVQFEAKVREQDFRDRLRELVASCMEAIPAGGEIDMTTLVGMILARTDRFGKKSSLRQELQTAIPPAHQGGVRIGEYVFDTKRAGTHKTATIYVCKRGEGAGQ